MTELMNRLRRPPSPHDFCEQFSTTLNDQGVRDFAKQKDTDLKLRLVRFSKKYGFEVKVFEISENKDTNLKLRFLRFRKK